MFWGFTLHTLITTAGSGKYICFKDNEDIYGQDIEDIYRQGKILHSLSDGDVYDTLKLETACEFVRSKNGQ